MTTPPSSFSTTTNPQEAFPLSLSYDTLESSIVHKLNTIQRNVDVIQSRLKLLGTIQDTHVLKSKLDQVQLETTLLVQQCANDVKQLNRFAESSGVSQNKLAARRILSDLANLTSRFQTVQQALLQKYKVAQQQEQHLLKSQEHDKESTPLLTTAAASSSSSSTVTPHPLLAEPELHELRYNDTLISERETEIQQIEQGVLLVNDVFKKIGTLVQDQGQLFDHIETNLQYTQIHLESADHELNRANKRTQKWQRCKCWFLGGLVVFFLLLLLIRA